MLTYVVILAGVAVIVVCFIGLSRRRQSSSSIEFSARQAEFDATLQHPDEVRRLLAAKQKIQAIKLYRDETGAGLKETKLAVEAIEEQMRYDPEGGEYTPLESGEEKMAEVRRLLRANQKIGAIKAYREATGAGLKEAKEAVERMEAGEQEPLSQDQPESPAPDLVDSEKLRSLIRSGRKIEAIKYFREQRGVGLKEAKDAVDWLAAQMRAES